MRSLIETVTFGQDLDPLQRWNPVRPFLVWKYGRTLDTYIRGELAKRFEERKSFVESRGRATDKRTGKSIVSLALDEYITNHMQTETAKLDSNFERYASAQIRLFLVAGHDTTSSALTYTLHLLYKHPEFLARVRAEHDSVFGTDAGAAADILSNDPTLLNQLPITSAAIKESLRLFPPAGGVREGSPDITLVAEDGTQYPTDGCAIWVLHEAVHRNPAYWPRADEFVPDRFLCEPEDPLYPTKGAWRAFEFGPHNCIGQTLALTEIKTLLVMVVRQFDLKEAYAEWDQSHPVAGLREANGERAYQVSGGGGGQHPSCRYPCRISVRE
jgi:cytochrome P450